MDPGENVHSTRRLKQIVVGKCHVQTAADRFGPFANDAIRKREQADLFPSESAEAPIVWPTLSSDDEEEANPSIYKSIPSLQYNCNNLTALSQVHNLYFVAYMCRIFVYRPRTVPAQWIPSRPDFWLLPQPTDVSQHVGNYPYKPRHVVNHLITGFLGSHEVLVASFDDGDVVAYYVKEVAARALASKAQQVAPAKDQPRPLLLTNIGKSAWGLAVHRKSRLIAASSNRHEITVFALALTTKKPFLRGSPSEVLRGQPERIVQRRARNWRIDCQLGPSCDNIPNLSFVDDEQGNAEKVCGIDINGVVWIVDIWKPFQPALSIPPLPKQRIQSEEFPLTKSRGWGVVVIPESAFSKVWHISDLFGVPIATCCVSPTSDDRFLATIRPRGRDIPGNPCPPPNPEEVADRDWANTEGIPFMDQESSTDDSELPSPSDAMLVPADAGGVQDSDFDSDVDEYSLDDDFDDSPDDPPDSPELVAGGAQSLIGGVGGIVYHLARPADDDSLQHPSIRGALKVSSADFEAEFGSSEGTALHQALPEDMLYVPHDGNIAIMPRTRGGMTKFLGRPPNPNPRIEQSGANLSRFGERYRILRGYEKDLELKGLQAPRESGANEVDILFPNIASMGQLSVRDRTYFYATSRLSMVSHMPELGALAIGSPTGRVLIVTLTRKTTPVEHMGHIFRHGFRVERILPLREDEKKYRQKRRPLYGLAVAPVRQSETGGNFKSRPDLPRRYRIMMHYRNHDIFTYEITREGQSEKLCIL